MSDINKAISTLSSSKIKDRNDGLVILESISSSRVTTPRVFRQITQAIFEFLGHETRLYKSNPSGTVEDRMVRVSSCLRILTGRMAGQLKYKSLHDLVGLILDNYEDPCKMELVMALGSVLSQESFKDHLSRAEWKRLYVFLCRACRKALGENEKLLVEVFRALHELLQCHKGFSISRIPVFGNYFDVLELVQDATALIKKESVLLVLILRIINKLQILATQDFRFVQKLVHAGVRLYLAFYRTSLEVLQNEFLIFLNSSVTFLDANLPKMIGTPHSFNKDSFNDTLNEDTFNEDTFNDFIGHRVKNLLYGLLGQMNSGVYRFGEGISMTRECSPSWFRLRTIYLSSQDHKPWMLCNGVAKLLNTYISLRSSDTSIKRPKVDVIADALKAESVLDFCNRLLTKDERCQQIALQILVFHVENVGTEDCSQPLSDSFNLFACDANHVLRNVLVTFDNNALHLWSLLAANALVASNGTISPDLCLSTLKIALQLLKNEGLCNTACVLVYNIIARNANESMDSSIITQFENLIDLAEINGPASISNESFRLWYAIAKVSREKNLQRPLADKIKDWLDAKWDRSDVGAVSELPNFIYWLCGRESIEGDERRAPYCGPLVEIDAFLQSYSSFEKTVFLKEETKRCVLPALSAPLLTRCSRIDELLFKISDTMMKAQGAQRTHWVVLVNQIAKLLAEDMSLTAIPQLEMVDLVPSLELLELLNSVPVSMWPPLHYDRIISHLPQIIQPKTTVSLLDSEFNEEKNEPKGIDPYYLLTAVPNSSMHAMRFLISVHIKENKEKVLLSNAISFMKSLGKTDMLYAAFSLVNYLRKDPISLVDISPFVRLLGEELLSTFEIERNELMVSTVAQLMSLLLPLDLDSDTLKDCHDMCQWLVQCCEKELILTETSAIEVCNFLIVLMENHDETFSSLKLREISIGYLQLVPNALKVKLSQSYVAMISGLSPRAQDEWYRYLFDAFPHPAESVETAATYTSFFGTLSSCSAQIMLSSLLNLIELSRFPFFMPYLERVLVRLCTSYNMDSPRHLFRTLNVEILKFWMQVSEVPSLPYALFGYSDMPSFIKSNYKELIAIGLAIRGSKFDQELLDFIVKVRNAPLQSLVGEALPLAITLAYTSDGVRNEIFDNLPKFLKESVRQEISSKLCLIMVEIIKYTDLSREGQLVELFPRSDIAIKVTANAVAEPSDISVPMGSSIDLQRKLVERFGEGEFWNPQTTYFVIRRISLTKSINTESLKLLLRKIKYVLVVSGQIDEHVRILLLDILSDLVCVESLQNDVFLLLDVLDMSGDSERAIPHITRFLANAIDRVNVHQLKQIRRYVDRMEGPEKDIQKGALNIIEGKPSGLNVASILSFLSGGSLELVSKVFPYVDTNDGEASHSYEVCRLLYNTPPFSREFQTWTCEYLAQAYLNGVTGVLDETSEFTSDIDFSKEIKYMDEIWRMVMGYLDTPGTCPEICACAESILGALEDSEYINKSVTEPYQHLLSLEFDTCLLLNEEDDVAEERVDEIVAGLAGLVEEPFEVWTRRLLLAFLHEMSSKTRLAALLVRFVMKVSDFAEKALPFFICFYVNIEGKDTVVALLQAFCGVATPSVVSIELFLRILLLIRIGSREMKIFREVIDQVDMEGYFRLAATTKLSKTAMMLFEDWKYGIGDPRISHQDAKVLGPVYESMHEAHDLRGGLPTETTVDQAILSLDSLQYASAVFDTGIPTARSSLVESSLSHGMMGIASMMSTGPQDSYEWAWKLGRWELPTASEPWDEHSTIYKALKGIHDAPARVQKVCEDASLELLANKTMPSDKWMRTLATLSSIQQLFSGKDLIEAIVSFDKQTEWFARSDLAIGENIVLARQVALQMAIGFPRQHQMFDSKHLWLGVVNERAKHGEWAKNSKEKQKMISAMVFIEGVKKMVQDDGVSDFSRFFAARMLWECGETTSPVSLLKSITSVDSPFPMLRVDASVVRATLVDWLSKSRHEHAEEIMREYVLPERVRISNEHECFMYSFNFSVFSKLARFCEEEAKSGALQSQIDKLEKRVNDKKKEIEELKAHYGRTSVSAQEKKSVQRFYSKLKSSYSQESIMLAELRQNREKFASTAVELYLKSVMISDDEEILDSFFALWLERSDTTCDVAALPSHKFVSWSTQLIARLSSESSPFQNTLREIIRLMCVSHPHHTLYQLISLQRHEEYAKTNPMLLSKVEAAKSLCERLAEECHLLGPIQVFCEQSVKLANMKPSRGKTITLDKRSYWLTELPRIPPPTKYMAVDRTMKYEAATFAEIDPKISIASSGLSLPKIATFTLSDGSQHKVLFKSGADDLRQDSIMEQVFDKVNHIFARDKETRRRNLAIRTYRAIPLGPTAGVIEFVPNSLALIDIVKPYHTKHDRIALDKARERIKSVQGQDKAERVRVFKEVVAKVTPVLHMFFADTFVTPQRWFESRVHYTHGVATNSMVGHILGLGDRHCNNILIDRHSGEPVHIDLGVAFDQGKRLPIPETVPFRLTRDVVDGFGCHGVEGIFRISCEHTFRVLRENKRHVLAILDVLRWDPLYTWSLSPIKRRRLQEGVILKEDEGSEAGRAVLTVGEKLGSGLSVEATVRELVGEAMSEENLGVIYFGWSPFY